MEKLRRLVAGRPVIPREPVAYRAIGVVRNRVRAPMLSGWEDVRSDVFFREDLEEALDGLDGFSHVIVVFHMHGVDPRSDGGQSLRIIDDPRLPEVGLLATRIPRRPNPIGVSVARVVHRRKNVLRLRGLDALDGTPVLDIKPYLPPYDAVPDAALPGWALGSAPDPS
jgi:tRNA-Thr(GGU) m(6)t(6)A37 methyltransferase TsaA